MKLFICADMEGATGVVHGDDLMPAGGANFIRGCRLLTGDINAAIAGAVEAGVTEVVVSEGHAGMRNVDIETLHPVARLVRGPASHRNKPLCQIAGLDESFDLAFFMGFHSRAGTENGLLSHTWCGAVVDEITLDGRVVGETAINAALCGAFGVPVALVSGADDLAREARFDLGDVEVAVTKRALGFNIAECWGPEATSQAIHAAAHRAVTRFQKGAFKPFEVSPTAVGEIEVHRRSMMPQLLKAPGLSAIGDRRARVEDADVRVVFSTLWRGITEVMQTPADWLR